MVHWSQLPEGPSPLTATFLSPVCPPEAHLYPPTQPLFSPLLFPPPTKISSLYSNSPPPPVRHPPGDTLSADPASEDVPFSVRTLQGTPFSPAARQLSAPCRPAMKQLTAGRGPRHPGTHASDLAARATQAPPPTTWNQRGGASSGSVHVAPGRGRCRSEPPRSVSTSGGNFHLCTADYRESHLLPKVCSQKQPTRLFGGS